MERINYVQYSLESCKNSREKLNKKNYDNVVINDEQKKQLRNYQLILIDF